MDDGTGKQLSRPNEKDWQRKSRF